MSLFGEIADAIKKHGAQLDKRVVELIKVEERQAKALEDIRDLLKSFFSRPPDPGPLGFTTTGEGANDMITGNVLLPDITQLSQKDQDEIVKGQLTVTPHLAGGEEGEPVVNDTEKTATVFPISGNQGDHAHLSFVWIDDAGNPSKNPATLTANFVDDVPPADPSALGFESTGEA